MSKHTLLLFLLVLVAWLSSGQHRYQADLFDEISIETVTYSTKEGENLNMDIYLPQNDSELERTTIIYVHGGGFSSGERDQEDIKSFCRQLANYGYVVASVSYRLTRKNKPEGFTCDCPASEKLITFSAAVEDVQDATFFLIENRHEFGINPQQIILAGSSAGAETALMTAYQPPYCYGLDSGPVSYAGVISMAGAITDTTILYDESAVPSLFFHGTDDILVPYGSASHHYCLKETPGYLMMHGAYTIAGKLNALEIPCWLHTTCGGNHNLHSIPFTNYFDVIVEFCYNFVVQKKGEYRHTIIKGKQSKKYPNYSFCKQ